MTPNNQNDNKPLVSVITVVLNDKKHIEETILSVINQKYKNIEYIVIDGGSSDGTLSIIKKYENKINHWVSEKDKGIFDAMNKGIELSSGEIINMMNSGDRYDNEYVIKDVMDIFKREENLSFVLGRGKFVNMLGNDLNILKNRSVTTTLKAGRFNTICHQAFFYKKSLHQEFGLYDLKYKTCADGYFMYRIYYSKTHEHCFLNKILAIRRYGGASNSGEAFLEQKKMYDEIFGKSLVNKLFILKHYLKGNDIGLRIYKFYEKVKYLVCDT